MESHSTGLVEMLPTLKISSAVVFVVLLIACSNVSDLLSVRSFARQPEMTIRLALGAGQGACSVTFLSRADACRAWPLQAGMAMAYWSRNLLVVFFSAKPAGVSVNLKGEIDWRVLRVQRRALPGLDPAFRARCQWLQAGKVDIAGAMN